MHCFEQSGTQTLFQPGGVTVKRDATPHGLAVSCRKLTKPMPYLTPSTPTTGTRRVRCVHMQVAMSPQRAVKGHCLHLDPL